MTLPLTETARRFTTPPLDTSAPCGDTQQAARTSTSPQLVRHAGFAVVAAIISTATAAAVLPVAPPGWTRESSGDTLVYRSAQAGHSVELRLLPVEQTPADLSSWFGARMASALQGVTSSSFDPATPLKSGVLLATGAGVDMQGRRVYLLRMGCQRAQGGAVYAESVASADDAFFSAVVPQAVNIFGAACVAAASDTSKGSLAQASTQAPSRASKTTRSASPAAPQYPYVKPAGTGLKTDDIEAVMHEWTNEQSGMTMQVRTYYHLLLKDGSFREGLPPVALQDFDAAAARRGEPNGWGRWTRSGDGYELSMGDKHYKTIPVYKARHPAGRDEKLEGSWEANEAYSTLWSVARSHSEIAFDRSGRFSKGSSSSVVGGAGSMAAGNAVHGAVVRDDDSSAATVGGANFGGGSSRQRPSTLSDRSGTYRLDGYTLELRYETGRVERLNFCATKNRDNITLDEYEMYRIKPKSR